MSGLSLQFKNVYKRFGDRIVMEDFSCVFKAHEITCITGKSGCGKTTLMRMILGFEFPDAGSILGLEGIKPSVVFQEDRLCKNLSAAANVRLVMPRGASEDEIKRIFEALGLSDALYQPVRTLSGGMRRRVALARALMADYNLLLLDEPFNGLDVSTRARAISCLRSRLAGRTAIVITHDPIEADLLEGSILTLSDLNLCHSR